MISNYFYHEIVRKTIISFGTLFNGIQIKHKDKAGDDFSIITVPIAYGPIQKFLARLEQVPDLKRKASITLPRISFEMTGIQYDGSRKSSTMQTFRSVDKTSGDIVKVFMPVPYNMDFELSVMTKLNDDMLQIVEQILPYFQPHYTLTVDLIDKIGEKKDVPIILNSLSMNDTYEGDFSIRRALIYTLKFTAKTYLFGPVSNEDVSKDIIKKVNIGLVSGDLTSSPRRELTYSVEPVATKSYTNNIVSMLSEDVNISASKIRVSDSSTIPASSYITISNETLYVKSKTENILTVDRGSYGTQISEHVSGTNILLVTNADNSLIEPGDNFGFGGEFL